MNLSVFKLKSSEFKKIIETLINKVPDNCHVFPLYGRLGFKDQQKAIQPILAGRKIVLATNVAETSLTIEGIETVIDSGLSKRSIYDPNSGMARLVTQKISKAEANQPFERLLKTDEVARAVLFLASADSGMMTGSIVDFDQSVIGCYESPPHPT